MPGRRLGVFSSYGVFAMMLGAAGLPIYIHAPKYFFDQYGVSLSTLGLALFALRSLDFVQDPILAALARSAAESGANGQFMPQFYFWDWGCWASLRLRRRFPQSFGLASVWQWFFRRSAF